jgi:hypothetical protein
MAVDDGLMEGGARSARFEKPGDTCEGVIVSVQKTQQRDFATQALKTYDDGNPMWQFVFTLQTSDRDGGDDDGMRRVFARGDLLFKIRNAVRAEGYGSKSVVGGTLKVQYTGNEAAAVRGRSPKKLYRAKFTPPPAEAADSWGESNPEPGSDSDDIPF